MVSASSALSLGLISGTHGLMRPEALAALAGSAGPRRFRLPVAAARLLISGRRVRFELVPL